MGRPASANICPYLDLGTVSVCEDAVWLFGTCSLRRERECDRGRAQEVARFVQYRLQYAMVIGVG
jgi:hypothetical protein